MRNKRDKTTQRPISPVLDPVSQYLREHEQRLLDGTALPIQTRVVRPVEPTELVRYLHQYLVKHNLVAKA
ncbi:MAG: hypothetical protein GXO92_05325 [FCB group bacterium]|nr:hypothetical protein [FCB group bacterium]